LKAFIDKYGEESISLQHNPLKDIIDSEIYTTGYIETFEDRDIRNKRLKACSVFCGKDPHVHATLKSLKTENNLI
tara:strand:- start:831 stop:1055 length:225 start_codon:yes stop_codon:yes gene_type:complete